MTGSCHCGNVHVTVQLAAAPGGYHPRACDCDFCRRHGAAYVSDPCGALLLRATDPGAVAHYRQGDALADMLLCRTCGVLLGALHGSAARLYGVVNARVLAGAESFAAEQAVTPRTLSAAEKVSRWHRLWFCDVSAANLHS